MGKSIPKKKGGIDFPLLILVTILTVFGVVMVFSASYYKSLSSFGTPYTYLKRQGFYAASGYIIMLLTSKVLDYRHLKKLTVILLVAGLLLLAACWSPLGVAVGGARRWVNVGITIMPGEVAKAIMIIVGASYFSNNMERARHLVGIAPFVGYTILVSGLIVLQPNLSTSITVFLIAVGIAFVAGLQWRYLGLMAAGFVGGAYYLVEYNQSYWHDRVTTFLDPFADTLGESYQVTQSLIAIGTGGLFGKGLGQSVQKNLYLPEPQNDFIFAIIGEELGFIGVAILLTVFAITVWRIFYIGLRSKDDFGLLLCAGTAIMIGVQVILNVAVVTSSMPATGIALPFISSGGNAIWIVLFLIGVVQNVARTIDTQEEEE